MKVDSSMFDYDDKNEEGDQMQDGNSQDAEDEDKNMFWDLYA